MIECYWIGWGRLVDSQIMYDNMETLECHLPMSSGNESKSNDWEFGRKELRGLIASRHIPGIPCLPILNDPAESESYSLLLIVARKRVWKNLVSRNIGLGSTEHESAKNGSLRSSSEKLLY